MSIFIGDSQTTHNTLALLSATRKTGNATILWGPPGVGKTALIRALAEQENAELQILLLSTLDPTDIAGLPMLGVNDLGQPVTNNTIPAWADKLNRAAQAGQGAILFLDELSTATPSVQAVGLSLIQGRLVGQHKLHDDVWIIAAANNADDAADGWELAAPLANRFLHVEYPFSEDDWFAGMRIGFGKNNLSEGEKEIRRLIVSFLSTNKKLIKQMPESEAERGKAWPSPRSWDNAAGVIAQIDDRSVRRVALRGFVGEAAEMSFDVWQKNLKLPPYAEIIAQPEKFDWQKFSADQAWVLLTTVLDNVSKDNYEASVKVFDVANTQGKKIDICTSLAVDLIKAVKAAMGENQDMKALLTLFKNYTPALAKAGVAGKDSSWLAQLLLL